MSDSERVVPSDSAIGLSRRDLFRTVGLTAGGAMLFGLPKFIGNWTGQAEAAVAPTARAAANVSLELDGTRVLLSAVEGGDAVADLVSADLGPDAIQRKMVGAVKFEDILVEVPFSSASKPLAGWIADTLANKLTTKTGAIVFVDFNGAETKRLEFVEAVITEVALPVCDARDPHVPATLALRITPQSTRLTGSTGNTGHSALGTKSLRIISSNFRFNIQGLEPFCSRIVKIERIAAKRLIKSPDVVRGVNRPLQMQRQTSNIDCSAVSITLPESDGAAFYQWFDDFVFKGNHGPDKERAGVLEWLGPDLKTVVASAQLSNLGIVRYAPEPIKAGIEKAALVQVDMYCQSMKLTLL